MFTGGCQRVFESRIARMGGDAITDRGILLRAGLQIPPEQSRGYCRRVALPENEQAGAGFVSGAPPPRFYVGSNSLPTHPLILLFALKHQKACRHQVGLRSSAHTMSSKRTFPDST